MGRFKSSDAFSKDFYRRLSMCFGHIAHYNREGFYQHFFTTTADKLNFLRQCCEWSMGGQPEYTFSDVEKRLAVWIRQAGLLKKYETQLAEEQEAVERRVLARLKAKYEGEGAP
jgi:hypothetical protein